MSVEPDLAAEHERLADDVGAWVLGALEPGESERFRAHLDRCVVCREEARSLQAVVDCLPLAAAEVPPPRGLARRISAVARDEARTRERARAREDAQRQRRHRALRPALALGCAGALAAGGWAIADLGSTPSTRIVTADVHGPGRAFVQLRAGHAELVVRGMAPPPLDKIYEVWIERRGHPAPIPTTALFNVTTGGSATVDVPGSLRGIVRVLVTPEPLGGSRTPTHEPVIESGALT